MPRHVVPASPPTEKWGERSVIRPNRPPTAVVSCVIGAPLAAIAAVSYACIRVVSTVTTTRAKNVSSAHPETADADTAALVKHAFSCLKIAKKRDFWNSSADQVIFQTHSQKEEYLLNVGI